MKARAAEERWRKWSPEEIGEGEKRLLAETDPVRVQQLKMELIRGFYGPPDS